MAQAILIIFSTKVWYNQRHDRDQIQGESSRQTFILGRAELKLFVCNLSKSAKYVSRNEGNKNAVAVSKLAAQLRRCADPIFLVEGKLIHDQIVEVGLGDNVFLTNLLLQMYGKCGALEDARMLFNKMHFKNSFTWNIMITAYNQRGQLKKAFQLFQQMPEKNVVTWTAMLAAHAQHGDINNALKFFKDMPKRNVVSWNAMITAYGQVGLLEAALQLFKAMPSKNIVSWNAIISCYIQHGHLKQALKLFQRMPKRDLITCNLMISAYVQYGQLQEAFQVFTEMPYKDAISWNAIISGYAQHGIFAEALQLFQQMPQQDISSCNAILTGYIHHRRFQEAVQFFKQMPNHNVVSWTLIIVAYAQNGQLEEGFKIFQKISSRDQVLWNTMIALHAQHGKLEQALVLFRNMPKQDAASWTAIIAGNAQNEKLKEALELFEEMRIANVRPESIMFVSLLNACARHANLVQGKRMHLHIISDSDTRIGNAIVDMYGKCGRVVDAVIMFDRMPIRNTVTWNTIIEVYTQQECGKKALHVFQRMKLEGVLPDAITCTSVICACCYAGLADESCHFFVSMSKDFDFAISLKHYTYWVDLLGRVAQSDEAEDSINNMPFRPDIALWTTLVSSCGLQADVERARRVAQHILALNADIAPAYILFPSAYAGCDKDSTL